MTIEHATPTGYFNGSFETTHRKLEQFLFACGIRHERFYQDPYGTTIWVYPDTPQVRRVVDSFVKLNAERKEGRVN